VAPPLWPRPSLVNTPIGPAYCYFDEVALFVPVTAPPALADGLLTFRAHVNWAVCKDVCKLGSMNCSVVVETTARPNPVKPAGGIDPAVPRYRKRLPTALDQVDGAEVSFDGTMLTVSGPAGGRAGARFFPDQSPGVTYDEPRVVVRGDRFVVRVEVEVNPNNAQGKPLVVAGLVAVGRLPDDPCYDFRLPVDVPPSR
jgi:DsbC/DsbD-like thiol-disulfide interchange protein